MAQSQYRIRKAKHTDFQRLREMLLSVARTPGGIARVEDEITDAYVEKILVNSSSFGLILVAETKDQGVVGVIHSYRMVPKVFRHVLTKLTIAIDPGHQRKGVGRLLFTEFLKTVEKDMTDVLRVELIVRETNERAVKFYESLGFQREGRLLKRMQDHSGHFVDDIPMAWINPGFKG